MVQFSRDNILRGSIVASFRCGGKFCGKFSHAFFGERISKNDYSLAEI